MKFQGKCSFKRFYSYRRYSETSTLSVSLHQFFNLVKTQKLWFYTPDSKPQTVFYKIKLFRSERFCTFLNPAKIKKSSCVIYCDTVRQITSFQNLRSFPSSRLGYSRPCTRLQAFEDGVNQGWFSRPCHSKQYDIQTEAIHFPVSGIIKPLVRANSVLY